LPPVNSINSLIPLDLRRYFGLPLPADKDAIFAHHFYRLLSGAENIHVLYSTNQGDDLAAAEPSRYLQQIELELKPVSKLRITHNTYNIPVSESISALSFSNSEEVRARILAYFQRGLSPSAMSKFLKCPMDFYVRYVLKYSDDEDVEEDIEHSTFGSVVHNTLEKLYTPFIGEVRPVLIEDIDRMLEICDSEVEVQFKNKFETSVDVFDRGAMYFALLAAKKQVRRFLKYERNLLKENPEQSLYIVSLEKKYEKDLSIAVSGRRETIKLLGNIDRVDRFGGKLRIVDYKTGKCEAFQVTIGGKSCENITEALQNLDAYDFESMKHLDQHYVLQLLVYLVLYFENQKEIPDAIGIISMRNLNDGLQQLRIKPKSNSPVSQEIPVDEKLAEFTTRYLAHLAELIMKTERFEHNPKSKYCLLCQG
jgi:ATP-dependent helicase/nuclease subunit B